MSGDFQIKNTIAIATALAPAKGGMISSSQAREVNGNFIPASNYTAGDDSLYD